VKVDFKWKFKVNFTNQVRVASYLVQCILFKLQAQYIIVKKNYKYEKSKDIYNIIYKTKI